MIKTLTVLFEDSELIAVDKPSGLLVHPSWISKAGEPTVMGILKQQLALAKLHTIHRLDRATSGGTAGWQEYYRIATSTAPISRA